MAAEDKDKKPKSDINFEYNQGFKGLNMDSIPAQTEKGELSYALNAAVENFDANSVTYQNEPSNEFCLNFPKNYILIGKYIIPEQAKQIFFLSNPETHDSEIGFMYNNDCLYQKLVNAKCLNFDIKFPIHKVVHRTSNCGTEIYWAQPNADRRYINLDPAKIPYLPFPDSTPCDERLTDLLDCNQLKVQPNYTIPQIIVSDVIIGGNIIAGTYQFAVQYSDALGNPLSSYHSVTNPTPIADPQFSSTNFNYPVGKSIIVNVSNIELGGQFDYFNLAVIRSINGITSVELVGTYNIDGAKKEIIYAGQNQTNIRLTVNDIFEKFPFYGPADDVTTAQDVLIWKGLSAPERVSYQKIASQITLQWETYRIPATENYSNELNATHLRGYLRDEVYPFEFVPLLRSGKQVDGFHIPGRLMSRTESVHPLVMPTNPDFTEDPKLFPNGAPYWRIYNTATVIGMSGGYSPAPDYKGPYNYGVMAFWESEEPYPCDEEMWGDLAGQPIRHHKFPDVSVSPIIESQPVSPGLTPLNLKMDNVAVYPIGIRVDIEQIRLLIKQSDLTVEQKADIVGFKIVRGDRTDNKSIVAKGILRNVGKYTRDDQELYYPNYPYNDLNADPFLNSNNNAYNATAKSWIVIVTTAGNVQYGDPNTNKPKTKPLAVGTHEFCSTSRPLNVDGVMTIGPADYDVWFLKNTDQDEFDVDWNDPYTTDNTAYESKHKRMKGDWFFWIDEKQVYMRVNTGDIPKISNCNTDKWALLHCRYVFTQEPNPTQTEATLDYGGGSASNPHLGRRTSLNCIGDIPLSILNSGADLRYRQIFNSPETSFGQPFLGDVLKLESVMFGGGLAHFVEVKDNAKYRLLTKEAQQDALTSAGNVGKGDAAAVFTAYEAYLEIYINGITRKNYAYSFNSIADYNYTVPIPNEQGIKQRRIDLKKYLIPVVQNVGESNPTIDVNNHQRETSVYLRTIRSTDALPFPHTSPNMIPLGLVEKSRFTVGCNGGVACATTVATTTIKPAYCVGNCSEPEKKQPISVVSYYASLKNTFRSQWGQIYSYQTIDTGFQIDFSEYDAGNNSLFPTRAVFGGDTFISRFAFKTKVPFFIDNRVGAPDDSEIFYDELGNIAYPKYWHSARSILEDFNVPQLGTMTNIISYKAHNFDCPNCQSAPPPNLARTYYDGIFYLFAYGIPNFYVETSYNTDLRQAFNNKEGEFWPHVSTSIPDDWVQESFVTILQDNTYYYNGSFSKQNTENYFSHIPVNWQFDECEYTYPYRAIFSDQQTSTVDTTVNNWLTYRAGSYFDFPQNYGKLTSLDGIDNRQILARFENKSLLYNALYTTQTNTGGQVYLGQSLLNKNSPPLDYAETDLGYVGSQHKFLLKIPQGQITADAKRGQIFLLSGNSVKDITEPGTGMNRFFTDHLAFEILRFFPNTNIDNNFNGLGLHGVYDSKYDRVIITKLDFIPLKDNIEYRPDTHEFVVVTNTPDGGSFDTIIHLSDKDYFCNKSWTLSYSLITQSWLSFHSYLPNWYIGENNFFYSGLKDCCSPFDFDFIGGELLPNPPTTTSTTTFPKPPVTTTTTKVPYDCVMEGGTVQVTRCFLSATSQVIVGPVPPTCIRPTGLTEFTFITGYDIFSPPSTVVSTGSPVDACNGYIFILTNPGNTIPSSFPGQALSIALGQKVYETNGTTDCRVIPNGFYTEPSGFYGVIGVFDGVITYLDSCPPATTTTTTTCNMYIYPVDFYNCGSCVMLSSGSIGNDSLLLPNRWYLDPVTNLKIFVHDIVGCSSGVDRSISISTNKEFCAEIMCPTTTTTTTL